MRPLILTASAFLLAGCAAAFPNAARPTGLKPISTIEVKAWAASTAPRVSNFTRFNWRMRDNDGSHGGRGSIYFAAPDSIQLHVLASLGLFSGDAAVVGDSALWAEPREKVEQLVPNYHLLWAMVGVARPPGAGWSAESHQDAKVTSVRYTRGSDTVDYVTFRTGQTRLETRVVDRGREIGQVWTYYDQFRHLIKSRLQVLTSPVLLDIAFDSVTKQIKPDRESWNAPHDH